MICYETYYKASHLIDMKILSAKTVNPTFLIAEEVSSH